MADTVPGAGAPSGAPSAGPTLPQLLDRANSAISAHKPFWDISGRWDPVVKEYERLRGQPESDVSRRAARSLLEEISYVANLPGLADDFSYYVQHPVEGVQTTVGQVDVTGKPIPPGPEMSTAKKVAIGVGIGAGLLILGKLL